MTRRAFTLIELLAVIVIMAIVIAIAVPSFNALLYNSSQTQAANQLQVGIQSARDAAVRSRPGADAAAVFFYEPGGRLSIVPCVAAGVLRDKHPDFPSDPDQFVEREVFVPVADFEPVQLPPDWAVRAYAQREVLHQNIPGRRTGWYDDANGNPSEVYPDTDVDPYWILPETGFYGLDAPDAGHARQTFMIRFEGGTGRQNVTDTQPVLVLSPALRSEALTNSLLNPMKAYPADRASSDERFVQAVLGAPAPSLGFGGSGSKVDPLRLADKQTILGDESVDTVLARPLSQVALYNARRLAASIGASGLNRETGTFLLPIDESDYTDPKAHALLDTSLFGGLSADEINERIRLWIEDRYPDDVPEQDRTPSDARIFGIRRYDGAVIELTGTRDES